MKKLLSIFACTLAMIFCLAACGSSANNEQISANGGVLRLSVNPEIAVSYDADGNVTEVKARNDDGSKIIANYSGYEGKACKTVVAELIQAIGEAGYFVEDADGETRQITLELEKGSQLLNDTFLNEVAEEVQETMSENQWTAQIEIDDDDDADDDIRTCTNQYCDDDDCDDADCDETPDTDDADDADDADDIDSDSDNDD